MRVWGSAIGASISTEPTPVGITDNNNTQSPTQSPPRTQPQSQLQSQPQCDKDPMDWRSPTRQPVSHREGLFSNRKRWDNDPSTSPVFVSLTPNSNLVSGVHASSFDRRPALEANSRLRRAFRTPSSADHRLYSTSSESEFRRPFETRAYARDFVWPVRTLPSTSNSNLAPENYKNNSHNSNDNNDNNTGGATTDDVLSHSYGLQGRRDWRQAKVAARHLKFCPGEQCGVWLPLHCFATNYNMEDGLDIYCIDCNARRREEKNKRRRDTSPPVSVSAGSTPAPTSASTDRTPDTTESGSEPPRLTEYVSGTGRRHQLVLDKYEIFRAKARSQTDSREAFIDPNEEANRARMREIKKRILDAHRDAQKRFRVAVQVDPTEVSRRLFMRKRFVCTVTGEKLTPECFLDHHSITFELRNTEEDNKQVMDIICSDCVTLDANANANVNLK